MSTTEKGITIVGLGLGDAQLITRQAWELLNTIPEIYLLTPNHPAVSDFPPELKVNGFDEIFEMKLDFEQANEVIIMNILEMGQSPEGVVIGVPGHPFIDSVISSEIFWRAKAEDIPIQVIEGVSSLGSAITAEGVAPLSQLTIINAQELTKNYYPLFPPHIPTLITHIHSTSVLSEIKANLTILYPKEFQIHLIHFSETQDVFVENLTLHQIDQNEMPGNFAYLFIPPLGEHTSFEEFQELIAHLRSPEGCPWDREQTHQSLRRNIMEETYEALQAIDLADPAMMQEEFGDLLLQVVLQAQIAAESGVFTMSDVIRGIYTKLVNRHPHVFGNDDFGNSQGVIKNWERLKALERGKNDQKEKGLLSGIPTAMPALAVADAYQRRAARVGFDWPDITGVMEKIKEEIQEFQQSTGEEEKAEEMGDLLFALANLARWAEIDPETALRNANEKFRERFVYIESEAYKSGKQLADMTLDEIDKIWEQAKGKF